MVAAPALAMNHRRVTPGARAPQQPEHEKLQPCLSCAVMWNTSIGRLTAMGPERPVMHGSRAPSAPKRSTCRGAPVSRLPARGACSRCPPGNDGFCAAKAQWRGCRNPRIPSASAMLACRRNVGKHSQNSFAFAGDMPNPGLHETGVGGSGSHAERQNGGNASPTSVRSSWISR